MTTPNIEELRLLAQTLEFSDAVRCSIQRAADLLQSQAERIKELEQALQTGPEIIAGLFARAAFMESERDTLRAQLADAELHTKQVERGLGKATAQLAEIEKTEPVAWRWVWKSKPWDIEGWCYTNTPPNHPELQEIEKLFTRPMPAQRLTELKLLMLATAYEQGVGKGIHRRDCNPYAADTDEHAAWKLGYEEGLDKPMPAQDVAELVEALEMIVSTHQGHCEHHVGVSKHSYNLADIAEEALSKYKGTK